MEKLQMFDCFHSNDKSDAFRIGMQLLTTYCPKINPRFFKLFYRPIGSSRNQDTTVTYIETVLKTCKSMLYERKSLMILKLFGSKSKNVNRKTLKPRVVFEIHETCSVLRIINWTLLRLLNQNGSTLAEFQTLGLKKQKIRQNR